jgi:hypothetical protein
MENTTAKLKHTGSYWVPDGVPITTELGGFGAEDAHPT